MYFFTKHPDQCPSCKSDRLKPVSFHKWTPMPFEDKYFTHYADYESLLCENCGLVTSEGISNGELTRRNIYGVCRPNDQFGVHPDTGTILVFCRDHSAGVLSERGQKPAVQLRRVPGFFE